MTQTKFDEQGVPQKAQQSNERRREILDFYLNGNIDDPSIVYWVPMLQERSAVLSEFEEFVIPALLPAACPTLNRAKWLGCESSFSWLGILSSHHDLLKKLLTTWRRPDGTEKTDAAAALSLCTGAPALGPQWSGWAAAMDTESRHSVSLPIRPAATNESDSEAEHLDLDFDFETWFDDEPNLFGPERMQDPITGDIDWKGMNKATIKKACAWAATSPANKVILIGIAWRPVLSLMRDMIFLGSDMWERNEKIQLAKGQPRSYRVLELLFSNSLKTFSKSLNSMFHTFCAALPPSAYKVHMRCLFFRILSRSGAATEQIYGAGLRHPPFVLFGALWGLVRPFKDLPKCLYDEFHSWIDERYPSETDLLSEECQGILHTVAQHLDFDIVGVEARHASVRRLTLNKSLQTWTASLQNVSADWVCRQAVIHSEPFQAPENSDKPTETAATENFIKVAKVRRPPQSHKTPTCEKKTRKENIDHLGGPVVGHGEHFFT